MPTWDDVCAIGSELPGVEVGASYGTPSLRVRGKFMCRVRKNPDALVVRVSDLEERAALLHEWPEVFFTTPHYDGYPAVLVRLESIDRQQLAEVIEDAWRTQAPNKLLTQLDAGA